MNACRLYGVSSGNGNDGVSHMFPDYYVYTSDPYRLARLAMVSTFKDEWKRAAYDAMYVDGEADYTIFACIYDPLDEPDCEDGESWSSVNGAWLLIHIFPDDEPREGTPLYYSLESCFEAGDLAMVGED